MGNISHVNGNVSSSLFYLLETNVHYFSYPVRTVSWIHTQQMQMYATRFNPHGYSVNSVVFPHFPYVTAEVYS